MDVQSMEFAHDLKMPVQLIYSCVQLLEMELSSNARAEEYLKLLMQSANQLQSMVHNALESRQADSEHRSNLKPGDVVARARSLGRQCALCARDRKLEFAFDSNVSGFRMPIDGEKLDRILQNLLSNALRFTPAGGRISLKVEVLGDGVDFVVEDSGCGIAPERQQRIFERGESEGSTGYGLSIVRDYARQLGGWVELKSAPGKGSRFTVHLPVGEAQA